MVKKSFVLRALSLLGLEEVLKLSEFQDENQVQLKKAAGEELIAWNDTPKKKVIQIEEAQVLPFPKKASLHEFKELPDPNIPEPKLEEGSTLISAEVMLWQREMAKESGGAIKKLDAFTGYRKSTQMYVVKTESKEGAKKIRFASTDGILVNKKQA